MDREKSLLGSLGSQLLGNSSSKNN